MEVIGGQEVDPVIANIKVEHIKGHGLDQGVAHDQELTRKRNPNIAIITRRRKVNLQDIGLRPRIPKVAISKTVALPPILPWSY